MHTGTLPQTACRVCLHLEGPHTLGVHQPSLNLASPSLLRGAPKRCISHHVRSQAAVGHGWRTPSVGGPVGGFRALPYERTWHASTREHPHVLRGCGKGIFVGALTLFGILNCDGCGSKRVGGFRQCVRVGAQVRRCRKVLL